jgi:choline transport protein
MVGSTTVNGIFGFAYSLVLMYGVSTVPQLLESETGFPFIQLYYEATQHKAGAAIMALVPTLVAMAGNAAGLASTSRTFWAFARDKGMPYSDFFAVVNPRFRIPLRVVLLVTMLEVVLGLISLGSTTALTAVLSMATTSVYLSYALPICYMLRARYKGIALPFRPFRMPPKVGWVINILAVAYLVVVMFFSTWPITYPVTRLTMNYDVVVLAGWLFVGSGYFLVRGRYLYSNPLCNVATFRE